MFNKMAKAPKGALNAKQFLQAYFAMQRPTTTHLFYTKGVIDFLVGILIGIVIGIILTSYI